MTLKTLMKLSLLEFIRDRIVWIGFFVAVLLFGLSLVLGSLSFNEQQRILAHFGWATIQLSTLMTSLILSANWLHKEMDRQTCLLVLARPVSRAQFLSGKYLSILTLILVIQFLLSMCLWALLGFTYSFTSFLAVFYGTFLEVAMVFSICFFSATFMRPTLAFFLGFGVFLIGNWIQEIQFFGQKFKLPFYSGLAEVLHWICPNLYQFNWRSVYFLENGISIQHILWATLHGAGWLLMTFVASILVFRRKDLV
jgi:Cu-processing system permease protein